MNWHGAERWSTTAGVMGLLFVLGVVGMPAAAQDAAVRDAGNDAAQTSAAATADSDGGVGDTPRDDELQGPTAPGDATAGLLEPIVIELPPVEPDPAVAPVLEDRKPPPEPPAPVPAGRRTTIVLKTLLGLLALLVLAYLGGHPRVQRWEQRLGISQVITAGLPFIVLGSLARHPAIGVLNDFVLGQISPLLRLGLGWIGFVVGFRLDARMLEQLPTSSMRAALWSALMPFALVLAASLPLLTAGAHEAALKGVRDPVFLRDAIILGLAAAMSSPTVTRLFASARESERVSRIIRLEELAGIVGLGVVAAFFRPQESAATWQIPGATWILLTVGLGTTLGLIVYAILQRRSADPDFLVLSLGSISFAAGAASYLHLSSVVVAFIAGALLGNLRGSYHERLRSLLLQMERAIYFVSLVVIGALCKLDDLRNWLMMVVFMSARLLGKWLATLLAFKDEPPEPRREARTLLAFAPMGSLAIAIVINAQLLYPGGAIATIAAAVVGGGVLTEMFLQFASRSAARTRRSAAHADQPPGDGA